MLGRNIFNFVGIATEKHAFGQLKLATGSVVLCSIRNISYEADNEAMRRNPKNREEINKFGLKSFAKKHRQYAQYNYEEWRYPEKTRAIDISCTRQIADPYKVEDGGGISSLLKTPRSKLNDIRGDVISKRILSRRVRDFHVKRFPGQAQEIYIEAHNLLNTENWTVKKEPDTLDRLDNLVTEHAFTDMVKGLNKKTLQWNYVETIEAPRVVKIRTPVMLNDDNYYGQVTVRFHSKQTLAIYDRFGRLMFGYPDQPRNILEYVVFERHISHPYGKWRIHGKIPANQYREPIRRTISIPKANPLTSEARAWHKEEEEIHTFKWYPKRHTYIEIKERAKRVRKGQKYHKRRRGFKIFCVKRTPRTRISRKVLKLIRQKRLEVLKLRKQGRLPSPPNVSNS